MYHALSFFPPSCRHWNKSKKHAKLAQGSPHVAQTPQPIELYLPLSTRRSVRVKRLETFLVRTEDETCYWWIKTVAPAAIVGSFDASNTCPPTNFTICWADPCLGKWNVMELHPIGRLELIKLQHVKLCMPPNRAFLARTRKREWQAFVGILFLETSSISNLVKRIHPDGSVPNEIGRCPYPSFCPCPCPVLSSQP